MKIDKLASIASYLLKQNIKSGNVAKIGLTTLPAVISKEKAIKDSAKSKIFDVIQLAGPVRVGNVKNVAKYKVSKLDKLKNIDNSSNNNFIMANFRSE